MIKQIFNKYGDMYIERFSDNIPSAHIKVIKAIQDCGTEASGVMTSMCEQCKTFETHYCSCGNRNCPLCQHRKSQIWLDKRMQEQLPGPYFMITFTVPEEIRSFIRSSQKDAYSALFQASSETLKAFISDSKYTGGDLPGFFGVLHTWGSLLQYHPHIHFIVPAGALDKQKRIWKISPEGFIAPVHAMSKVFKGKFLDIMKKKNLDQFIDPTAKRKEWNVNAQYIKSGSKGALKYLATYVFKVAISNNRIISIANDKVTFKYKKKNSERERTATLDVFEFMRRFLQHVLPSGFMKIRYYGFMSGGCRISHNEILILAEIAYNFEVRTPEYEPLPEPPPRTCKKCGGELKYVAIKKNGHTILLNTS